MIKEIKRPKPYIPRNKHLVVKNHREQFFKDEDKDEDEGRIITKALDLERILAILKERGKSDQFASPVGKMILI